MQSKWRTRQFGEKVEHSDASLTANGKVRGEVVVLIPVHIEVLLHSTDI